MSEPVMLAPEAPEVAAFRAEVRDFIRAKLPGDISRKCARGMNLEKDDFVRWEKALREKGWLGAAWPTEYGGAGWDLGRQLTFVQEAAMNDAPMLKPYGVNMVGPVIYNFGTDVQKASYLPDILESRTWWCQGYSEPNAGSDLASLATSARREGDHYVVNGTKMWTTEAHFADMMHCLVRTGREGKPQQGISFLLVDMRAVGVTVEPIMTIEGHHHTNQVFLDNVRVPVENLVGLEGGGWRIAKFLLANERIAIADTGPKLRLLAHIRDLAANLEAVRVPAAERARLRDRIADLEIQLAVLVTMERRYIDAWAAGGDRGGPEASVLKIRGTEILQGLTVLALELEGPWAAVHQPSLLAGAPGNNLSPAQRASAMAGEYLAARAWSIFGGSNEIQRNLIAQSIARR